jgi:hypothetical protein
MPQLSLKLKALACSVLVVGVMSLISVSAAQGEAGANWRVNGTNVNSTLLPEVQVKELENSIGELLFTTKGGTKVAIGCKELDMFGVKFGPNGNIVSADYVKGLNCSTKLNGTTTANCKPRAGGEALGTIKSREMFGLMVLSGGVPVAQVKPVSGTEIATIELGELCAIGETVPVAGVMTAKDCQGKFTVESVEHLIEQGPGTALTALGQPATLDGSAVVKLTGAHTGLKFSGSPA